MVRKEPHTLPLHYPDSRSYISKANGDQDEACVSIRAQAHASITYSSVALSGITRRLLHEEMAATPSESSKSNLGGMRLLKHCKLCYGLWSAHAWKKKAKSRLRPLLLYHGCWQLRPSSLQEAVRALSQALRQLNRFSPVLFESTRVFKLCPLYR